MSSLDETFFFISPEVHQFLDENGIEENELLGKIGLRDNAHLGGDPASSSAGQKEPVTILLASAAIIAAATPLLRELIRNLSGRDAIVRERRLLPVEDNKGEVVRDATGSPILHWVDVVKGQTLDEAQSIKIKGFGIEIAFGE